MTDHLHAIVLTILFSGSISCVLVLSVRVSATVERSLSNCFARMVYTTYKKQHILHFYSKGYKAIQKFENIMCSHDDITAKFIKVFERTGTIYRQPGLGRPSKVTCEVKDLVNCAANS